MCLFPSGSYCEQVVECLPRALTRVLGNSTAPTLYLSNVLNGLAAMLKMTVIVDEDELRVAIVHAALGLAIAVVANGNSVRVLSRVPAYVNDFMAQADPLLMTDDDLLSSGELSDVVAAAYEASAHAPVAPPAWASMHRLVVDFEVDVCRALSARADACRRAASVDTFLASIPLDGSIVNARRP